MIRHIRKLVHDQGGAAAVLFAVSLPPLMGVSAMAVDLGSMFLAERRLQNLADAAAAAAVTRRADEGAQDIVSEIIDESGESGVEVATLVDGEYSRDPAIAYDARFDATSLQRNASRVVLRQEIPLFFGQLVLGRNTTQVTAQATAAKMDMAGFSLGTRIASIDPGLANSVLSALAGTPLNLTAADIQQLQNTPIDVLDFAEQLAPLNGEAGRTFGEVMDSNTQLHSAVEAIGAAAGNGASALLLGRIADTVGSDFITPSAMIDLGPLGHTDVNDGNVDVEVDAYSLLRASLQASHGDSYHINFNTSLAGLSTVTVHLAGGYGEERSPWLTVDRAQGVILRTAETRVYVNANTPAIGNLPLGLNVPVYAELAGAEAQLTDIICYADDGTDGVDISATPSLGELALASLDTSRLNDFTTRMGLDEATLLRTPLVEVTGFADVELGGGQSEMLHFSMEDIAAKRTQSAGTRNVLTGAITTLAGNTEIGVKALGLSIVSPSLKPLVSTTLGQVAPALDGLVNSLTDTLGVRLGVADVTVDRIRCGRPTLVG
jgi:uncharacterized membrane protein